MITQGEWKHKLAINGDWGIIAPGTGVFIECFTDIRYEGESAMWESHDNALLVCAAPAMLAALKTLDAWWSEGGLFEPDRHPGHWSDETIEIWRQIRSAIALAEGVTS